MTGEFLTMPNNDQWIPSNWKLITADLDLHRTLHDHPEVHAQCYPQRRRDHRKFWCTTPKRQTTRGTRQSKCQIAEVCYSWSLSCVKYLLGAPVLQRIHECFPKREGGIAGTSISTAATRADGYVGSRDLRALVMTHEYGCPGVQKVYVTCWV